jgi:hypothetical protein
MTTPPRSNLENFDWVAAQHDCTAERAFWRLREQVKFDVESRNAQLTPDDPYRVFLDDQMVSKFTVSVTGVQRNAVSFELVGNESIHVENASGTIRFDATLRLNNFGICRFFITADGETAQAFDWQLRMRALKWLFFGGEPPAGAK